MAAPIYLQHKSRRGPTFREALLMLGRVALNRKLPPPDVLGGWESAQWIYESVDGELRQEAAAAVAELPVDWALVPVEGRRKKLLIADMDSTIINVECLDELADFIHHGRIGPFFEQLIRLLLDS